MPRAKPPTSKKPAPCVALDYPQPNASFPAGPYTIRVSANGGASTVSVSLDGGEFQACRESAGHWWFDCDLAPGSHSVVARMSNGDGDAAVSRLRRFKVLPGPAGA